MNRKKMIPGKIFVLSGPSGSGKTTLHNHLLRDQRLRKKLVKLVSVTTREKRAGEKAGKHYLFFGKRDFLQRTKRGYFLEWQKVFTDYYGTPKLAVDKTLKSGKNVLLCIDVKGAKIVFKKCPEAVGIFVKAPSSAVLKQRLSRRGTEDIKAVRRRLSVAQQEMKEAKRYDYVVVNDKISKAVAALKKIIQKELRTKQKEKKGLWRINH